MRREHPQAATGSGFTLVELMVAMFITVILGSVVVMAYNTSMQSYYRTEKQLQALAAFRNTTDRLEREVNSMVFKAGVYPHPVVVGGLPGSGRRDMPFWDTRAKYLNGDAWISSDTYSWASADCLNSETLIAAGNHTLNPTMGAADMWRLDPSGRSMYQINFRPRYMGYYSTLDGFTIDRTEWYFNPAEEKRLWANGLDDDGDDPDGPTGLRILFDDRGCLMFRKTFDKDMLWAEWYHPGSDPSKRYGDRVRPNDYRDPYHGPYTYADFDVAHLQQELQGPIPKLHDNDGDGTNDNIDTGTVIGEGFTDLRFHYLYKLQTTDQFVYADWWPWDDDDDPTNGDDPAKHGNSPGMPKITIQTRLGGSWYSPNWNEDGYGKIRDGQSNAAVPKDFDISYFSLPLAISARFTFAVGRQRHVYEKLIYLHASRWLKYLNR